MTVSLLRLDQVHKPDTFTDTLDGTQVAGIESSAVDYADFQHGILSQIKRFLHGSDAGNWHDNPESVFTTSATLKVLHARATLEGKLILTNRLNLNDVAVPSSQNYVALTGAGKPDKPIAIAATSKGGVAAQLAGAIGSHSLTEIAGANPLKPKNLVQVFDGATGDPVTSSDRRVYALLQVGSAATDGNNFGDSGNDQGQLSFVRPDASYADLEACPVADIQGKSIIYAFSWRESLSDKPEDSFRGDIDSADPQAGVTVSLDSAYDGGTYMTVDATDVDIRLADTKSWVFRKGAAGVVLFQITRNDAGVDKVLVDSAVDQFDVDAADSDFAEGASFDTNDQTINVGKTAIGVIDSAAIETRATTGDNVVSSQNAEVKFQTVNETTALALDDATAGPISGLAGGPHASISAAIKYAMENGGVDINVKVFIASTNYAQGVNIPAATLDLTAYTIDMNTPANTDAFIFLNGRLLHGGNGTTKNDVYAGTTPGNGDIMVDFPKGIKAGDVVITIGMQQ
jgi:hypothetical protein